MLEDIPTKVTFRMLLQPRWTRYKNYSAIHVTRGEDICMLIYVLCD